jgi:molybdopterin-guanine dinucleotide biosynthesis protein A
MSTFLGVLVAGGAGARLGLGRPKAEVALAGTTLLERGLRTLAVCCDEVVVATPAARPLTWPPGIGTTRSGAEPRAVQDAAGPPGGHPAGHDRPAGPLAGMVAGLAACPFERAIVLGVDFPFIGPDWIATLLDRLGGHDAVVPAPGGIAQPLAAVYAPRAAALLAARHAAGEGAPSRALSALRVLRLEDAELARMPGGIEACFNLNTPADLAEAERRMAARAASR